MTTPRKFCGSNDVELWTISRTITFEAVVCLLSVIIALIKSFIHIFLFKQSYHAAQEEERRKRW